MCSLCAFCCEGGMPDVHREKQYGLDLICRVFLICEAAELSAPEYDVRKIYESLQNKTDLQDVIRE